MEIKIADIVKKRRLRWEERHDIEFDRTLTRAAAVKILQTPALRAEVEARPYLLIEATFTIVNKEGGTVPFFLNEVQRDFIEKLERLGTDKPFFILKGRQQGFTSLITAIQLSFAIVRRNFSGFTMADSADNTRAIFNDKAHMVYERLPEELKPSTRFSNRNEFFFDKLNSSWRVATATAKVGRSRTLQFVHFSEVAFYECLLSDLQSGVGEAIVNGAIVVYETTANGFGEAKDLWDSGSCHDLFYEWFRTPEYRSTEYAYLEEADTWLAERLRLLEGLGCDREQRCWYAKKYAGYLDKALIRQEYPTTPDEAFLFSGECVFDREAVTARMAEIYHDKPRTGYFTYRREREKLPNAYGVLAYDADTYRLADISFQDDPAGYIRIHEEPRTVTQNGNAVALVPYVLGGDTAGTGEDYFTGKMIDNMTGRTVATLQKQRMDEDVYAEQMLCLAKYYHDAYIGIETNYSRHPVRVIQQKYGYTNLYLREKLTGASDKPELVPGFETTSRTRPIIIGELVSLMRREPHLECDRATLAEMTTFVKKENGRQEAVSGAHDDLVMALAIAHFISASAPHEPKLAAKEQNLLAEHFHLSPAESGGQSFISWEDF